MGRAIIITSNFMDKKVNNEYHFIFVPNITIAGGIFRIVSDKMNYLAENMEGRLFLAYYGNGQEKPIYPLHPNISTVTYWYRVEGRLGKKINRVWKNISIIRHIFKKI